MGPILNHINSYLDYAGAKVNEGAYAAFTSQKAGYNFRLTKLFVFNGTTAAIGVLALAILFTNVMAFSTFGITLLVALCLREITRRAIDLDGKHDIGANKSFCIFFKTFSDSFKKTTINALSAIVKNINDFVNYQDAKRKAKKGRGRTGAAQ